MIPNPGKVSIKTLILCLLLSYSSRTSGQKTKGEYCDMDPGDCTGGVQNHAHAMYCKRDSGRTLCACAIESVPTEDGAPCPKWKGHNDTCQSTAECNPNLALSCIQGICQCDPETTLVNPVERNYNFNWALDVFAGTCVSKAGFNCSIDESGEGNQYNQYCVDGALCYDGKCSCKDYLTATKSGECGGRFDMLCPSHDVCADALRCFAKSPGEYNFKCQCPHPKFQTYDSNRQICRGLLYAPCDPTESEACSGGAKCQKFQAGGKDKYRCECPEGSIETAEEECEVGYGGHCYHDPKGPHSVSCDQKAKLACKKEVGMGSPVFKCGCPNEEDVFDPNLNGGTCAGPVGLRCTNNTDCPSNAHCSMKQDNKWGLCACDSEYAETNESLCVRR